MTHHSSASQFFFLSMSALCACVLNCPFARADFHCGPNLRTYQVETLDGSTGSGTGVRCVRFVAFAGTVPSDPEGQYAFVWYGEGYWGSTHYRHLGRARWVSTNSGVSYWLSLRTADFGGNGETVSYRTDGGIQIGYDSNNPPTSIRLTGAWNERWVLRSDGTVRGYNPLGPVTSCGPNFVQYSVSSRSDVPISGVRCQLESDAGLGPLVWYAEGSFENGHHMSFGITRIYTQNNQTFRRATLVDICDVLLTGVCRNYQWTLGTLPQGGLCVYDSGISGDQGCPGVDIKVYDGQPYFEEYWSRAGYNPASVTKPVSNRK